MPTPATSADSTAKHRHAHIGYPRPAGGSWWRCEWSGFSDQGRRSAAATEETHRRRGALLIYSDTMAREFTTVLRGYEKRQVDSVLGRVGEALTAGGDAAQRAAARATLRAAKFEVALRGYDRLEVDDAVQSFLRQLDIAAAGDELRKTLGSVLRMPEPTDRLIIEEVQRLRALADEHNR
jgi:DivIVA domain-containing protein